MTLPAQLDAIRHICASYAVMQLENRQHRAGCEHLGKGFRQGEQRAQT